jgi:hypothetical protein
MIYTVCIMAFATFSYKRPAKVQVLIALGLIGLAVFITVCGNHAMLLLNSSANQHGTRPTIFTRRTPSSTRWHTAS